MRGMMLRYGSALALVMLLAGCAGMRVADTEAPLVTLSDLRVGSIGLFEQRYIVDLRVRNPNPVALAIGGLDYRLSLNETPFGSGVSDRDIVLDPYSETTVSVDIVSTTGQTLQQIRRIVRDQGSTLRYELRGSAYLKELAREVPFNAEGSMGLTDAEAADEPLL